MRDPPLSALGGGRGKVRLREVERGARDVDRRRSRIGGREGGDRRERDREARRPGVAFAPVPGYGYVLPPGM